MPIIHSLIAFKGEVIADQSSSQMSGNFGQVAAVLVKRLSNESESKLSLLYQKYMFHYILSSQWCYLVMTDQSFPRVLAFQFLNDIINANVTHTQTTDPNKMEMRKTLRLNMDKYNSNLDHKFEKLYDDINNIKDVMVSNVEKLVDRNEDLTLLVEKSDNLNQSSIQFAKQSTSLKRSLWWKNAKMILILALSVMFIIYLIVSSACGGLSWPNC